MGADQVLTHLQDAAELADDWRRLAERAGPTSYFVSPDWVLGWWEALGGDLPAEVAVWRDGSGKLEAVVPVGRIGERLHHRAPVAVPVRVNLGSGAGAADHCGWPVLPDRMEEVRAFLAEKAATRPLLLRDLDPELGVPLVPDGARRVGVSVCPRLLIPPDGQEPARSANFRGQLRSSRRKLERQGIGFRWVGSGQVTDELLETVYRLHEHRWSQIERPSSFDRSRAGLHRRLIARASAGRGPAVVLAERDGIAVGALYGFCWRDEFAYYQMGWEPEWASQRLGLVLVAEAIRLAGLAGARVFDFLRGAEPYKYRFGASDRVDETWLVPRGPGGRLLNLRYRLKARR